MNTGTVNRPGRARGFSLIELMIVISIAAIMATIAAPSFRELIASQRARAAASALFDSLLLARSEAIKRNSTITLTANSSDLSNGWNVLLADGTTSIRSQEALNSLSFSPADPTTLVYTALGRLSGTTQTVTITGSGSAKTWSVRADASGRVCIVEGGSSC